LKAKAHEVMTSLEAPHQKHLIRSTFHQKHISSEADRSEALKGCSKDLITPYHCRRPKGWSNSDE